MYGLTPAEDFGPKKLKALRDWMIAANVDGKGQPRRLTRRTINGRIVVIKRVFEYAVESERIGEAGLRLRSVKGLRKLRSDARDSEEVRPVSMEHVDAIRP